MASLQEQEKTERLDVRTTRAIKELIAKAAALKGQTVSDFVLTSSREDAARTVREHEVIQLNANDSRAFVAALLRAPVEKPRLKKAVQRYKERR